MKALTNLAGCLMNKGRQGMLSKLFPVFLYILFAHDSHTENVKNEYYELFRLHYEYYYNTAPTFADNYVFQ